jgi:hypothetical protein
MWNMHNSIWNMMSVFRKANAALRHDNVYQNEIFSPKKYIMHFFSHRTLLYCRTVEQSNYVFSEYVN